MTPSERERRIAELERALAFYADARNYHKAFGGPGMHLWEIDKDDPSRWWPEPTGWRADRGDVARQALAGDDFYVPWDPGKPPAISPARVALGRHPSFSGEEGTDG